jgi:nucleoside-diphosphate-sugar epimerase
MTNALIGYTGFVGSTLLKQTNFGALFNSANIHEIDRREFDIVLCAGAPAQKWIANQHPQDDLGKIKALISHLRTVRCKTFILISTVDVFQHPTGVNEDSPVQEKGLHPYGLHRRYLERFVQEQFAAHLMVRLPGLVGPGLRKNVIFDLHNTNGLQAIESRARFQFYPMVNLWSDIAAALRAGLTLVHLTAAPVTVAQVAQDGFGRPFTQTRDGTPAAYDMQTRHAAAFGGVGDYQYSARETMLAVRAYAQSEPSTPRPEATAA